MQIKPEMLQPIFHSFLKLLCKPNWKGSNETGIQFYEKSTILTQSQDLKSKL